MSDYDFNIISTNCGRIVVRDIISSRGRGGRQGSKLISRFGWATFNIYVESGILETITFKVTWFNLVIVFADTSRTVEITVVGFVTRMT